MNGKRGRKAGVRVNSNLTLVYLALLPSCFPWGSLDVGPGRFVHGGEARLHAAPQILIDDPQMRHILRHPLPWRVHAGDAFARGRVLDEAHGPVHPHLTTRSAPATHSFAVSCALPPVS